MGEQDAFEIGQLVARLTRENEAMRKALEPFAEIAKELLPGLDNDRKNTMHWAVPTVGQLRAALAVLSSLKENGNAQA